MKTWVGWAFLSPALLGLPDAALLWLLIILHHNKTIFLYFLPPPGHTHISFLYLYQKRWPLTLARLSTKRCSSRLRRTPCILRQPKPMDYLLLVRQNSCGQRYWMIYLGVKCVDPLFASSRLVKRSKAGCWMDSPMSLALEAALNRMWKHNRSVPLMAALTSNSRSPSVDERGLGRVSWSSLNVQCIRR